MLGLFSWLLLSDFIIHNPVLRFANMVIGPVLADALSVGIVRWSRRGTGEGFPWRPALYMGLAYFAAACVRLWKGY